MVTTRRSFAPLVLAAVVGIAACSGGDDTAAPTTAPPTTAAASAIVPERIGEASEVIEEEAFTLVAQDSVEGVCLEVRTASGATEGCGFEVPERHEVGSFTHAAEDGARVVAGVVAADAAGVRLELVDGEPLELELVDTVPSGARAFATAVDGVVVDAVVALGPAGEELERRPVPLPREP